MKTISRLRVLLLITGLVFTGLVGVSSPAFADSTSCSGASYSTCVNAGYTDHGYGANSGNSYWRMYSGHNCTNYVAYVEQTVNGAPTPSYLLGNADTWYGNASSHGVLTNSTPAKGAVAWWGDASWNGNSGHVAYVESYNNDGSITISEDSAYSGPFDWKVVSPGSSYWPNGFIHFKDMPSNTPMPGNNSPGVGNYTYYTTTNLSSGDTLLQNYYINSANNYYALIMQSDGNLVMYGPGSMVVWTSNTAGANATHATMMSDGELVIFTANQTVAWTSGTSSAGASHLSVGDDGNLAIVQNSTGAVVWQNGPMNIQAPTFYGSDTLATNQSLPIGYFLRSSDNRYSLTVQSNGHLILYGPMYHILWDSGYSGGNQASLVMQGDGNLVLYAAGGVPAWASGTGYAGPSQLKVQSDGKFVVYTNGGQAVWQSGPGGTI